MDNNPSSNIPKASFEDEILNQFSEKRRTEKIKLWESAHKRLKEYCDKEENLSLPTYQFACEILKSLRISIQIYRSKKDLTHCRDLTNHDVPFFRYEASYFLFSLITDHRAAVGIFSLFMNDVLELINHIKKEEQERKNKNDEDENIHIENICIDYLVERFELDEAEFKNIIYTREPSTIYSQFTQHDPDMLFLFLGYIAVDNNDVEGTEVQIDRHLFGRNICPVICILILASVFFKKEIQPNLDCKRFTCTVCGKNKDDNEYVTELNFDDFGNLGEDSSMTEGYSQPYQDAASLTEIDINEEIINKIKKKRIIKSLGWEDFIKMLDDPDPDFELKILKRIELIDLIHSPERFATKSDIKVVISKMDNLLSLSNINKIDTPTTLEGSVNKLSKNIEILLSNLASLPAPKERELKDLVIGQPSTSKKQNIGDEDLEAKYGSDFFD